MAKPTIIEAACLKGSGLGADVACKMVLPCWRVSFSVPNH